MRDARCRRNSRHGFVGLVVLLTRARVLACLALTVLACPDLPWQLCLSAGPVLVSPQIPEKGRHDALESWSLNTSNAGRIQKRDLVPVQRALASATANGLPPAGQLPLFSKARVTFCSLGLIPPAPPSLPGQLAAEMLTDDDDGAVFLPDCPSMQPPLVFDID